MDLPNILLCCVARDNREQISARIIYERAHGQRKQENKGKDGKPLSDVHDEAPSQVPAYPFQKVERGSGERGSAADHQRPERGVSRSGGAYIIKMPRRLAARGGIFGQALMAALPFEWKRG